MNKYSQKMQELGARQLGIHHGYDFPPISEEKMLEVERKLGTSLPPDYREFVRGYGFCYVDTPLFSFQREGQLYTTDISSFRGIAQHAAYQDIDIVRYSQGLAEDLEEWSSDWISIANAGSAMIALAVSGPDCGKVFYFSNSTGGDYHIVANSFDEFMNLLEPQST